jgi:hypothetical protein
MAARQRRKRHAKNREDALRKYQLIATSVAMILAFAAPAVAQTSAANDQYDLTPCSNAQNINCTQSIEDGFKAMTEDSAKKAEAAGVALSGDAPGSESDSEKDPGTGSGDDSSSSGAKDPTTARAANTMELPDTGGPPLATLGVGVLLAGGGLFSLILFR